MKTIIKGKYSDWPKQIKCQDCESVIEIEKQDVLFSGKHYSYFICPECNDEVDISHLLSSHQNIH